MRAITLYPEHAELFRLGLRTVETRGKRSPWHTAIGERVALHAGARDPDSAAARRDPLSLRAMDRIPHGDPFQMGAVVGTFTLADVVPIVDSPAKENCVDVRVGHPEAGCTLRRTINDVEQIYDLAPERDLGEFTPGRWALVLEELALLLWPVPARGAYGLWRLPEEVEEMVWFLR